VQTPGGEEVGVEVGVGVAGEVGGGEEEDVVAVSLSQLLCDCAIVGLLGGEGRRGERRGGRRDVQE
jgi:hypothetical protein